MNKYKRGHHLAYPRSPHSRAQQEMVGFILIVVLVVVAMMVFLVLSIKNTREIEQADSLEARNMLDAILAHTTECAIVFEPQFDSFEDLFKSAYEGDRCSNKNKDAEEYLPEELRKVLTELSRGEASIQGTSITFVTRDETGEAGIIAPIETGDCNNAKSVQSAQRNLVSGGQKLIVRLRLCRSA